MCIKLIHLFSPPSDAVAVAVIALLNFNLNSHFFLFAFAQPKIGKIVIGENMCGKYTEYVPKMNMMHICGNTTTWAGWIDQKKEMNWYKNLLRIEKATQEWHFKNWELHCIVLQLGSRAHKEAHQMEW